MSRPDATHHDDGTEQTEAQRRKRTREAYEAAIRAVDYNSGRVQPPLASKPSVLGTLSRGRWSYDEAHSATVAACANGDLVRITDAEGRVRLGIDDADALVAKTRSHAEVADDPRRDVIGLANQRVQQLRERERDGGDGDE